MRNYYFVFISLLILAFQSCKKEEEVKASSFLHFFNSRGREIRMKDAGFSFLEGKGWNSRINRFDKANRNIWTCDLSKKLIHHEEAYYSILSICETKEGGLAGFSFYQDTIYGFHYLKMFKINREGVFLWERLVNVFYSPYSFNFSPFYADNNDNFISSYFLYSTGLSSAFIKIDSSGNYLSDQYTNLVSFSLFSLSDAGDLYAIGEDFFLGESFLYRMDTSNVSQIQFQIFLLTNKNVLNQYYQTTILPSNDGGCIIAGYTNSESNTFNFYIQKFNSSGGIDFTKRIGTINHDYLSSAIRTRDGGLLLVGTSSKNGLDENQTPDLSLDFNSKLYIVKLDASYNLEWEKNIGADFGSQGIDVNEDQLNQFFVLGKQASHGNDFLNQLFILRLKPDGSDNF